MLDTVRSGGRRVGAQAASHRGAPPYESSRIRSAAIHATAITGAAVFAGDLNGQHGRVDDAQPVDAPDAQLGIHDIVAVRTHRARTDGVVAAALSVDGMLQSVVA
jgi:hypothetical protein